MSFRITPDPHSVELIKSTQDTTHRELGGHDAMRHGVRSIKSEVLPGHPLEHRLSQWEETQWDLKLSMARQAYGLHAPMKMMMERDILSKQRNLSLLPDSDLHLDVLMGKNETIDFQDFLSDPTMSTELPDVRAQMEQKLGIPF